MTKNGSSVVRMYKKTDDKPIAKPNYPIPDNYVFIRKYKLPDPGVEPGTP